MEFFREPAPTTADREQDYYDSGFDAFWELALAPWDVAAGILLVREAGGVVTDLEGARAKAAQGAFVAGNPIIHPWLLETVQRAAQSR